LLLARVEAWSSSLLANWQIIMIVN